MAGASTDRSMDYTLNLMGQGENLSGLMPNVLDAANYYLQHGTGALGKFGTALDYAGGDIAAARGNLGSAQQILGNVMNPTAYNPLYQSALDRQTAGIDSMLASRGLAASGPGLQAEAASNLSDQFGMRQFQEQLGAMGQNTDALNSLLAATGQYGSLAGGYGNLAANLAGMPSSIYGQMAGTLPYFAGMAGLPQQVTGTYMDLMRTAGSMPLETIQDIWNITRAPTLAGGQMVGGTIGPNTVGRQRTTIFGIPI